MKKKRLNLPTSETRLGRGTLESKRNPGKLEKFTKNKKQKRIIIGSIIGVILLIGGITLYKTFALYEEKKEFNALKGVVPDFNATILSSVAQVGDYVSYTPSKTSYTTDTSYTGDTSTQTINPSELNLWRVINITDTGVELVSEYVSSTNVTFRGQKGYQNYVGYLNILASQYETEGITIGSRYMGYNGQTEFITDTSKLESKTAPWTSTTSSSTSSADEALGAGDMLYTTDVNLVENALGTLVAYAVDSTSSSRNYWLSGRGYWNDNSIVWSFGNRAIATYGEGFKSSCIDFSDGTFFYGAGSNTLRPIVIANPQVTVKGYGTADNPWVLN